MPRFLFAQYLNETDLECISIVPQIPPLDGQIPMPYYPTGNDGDPTYPEHPDWAAVNENGWYNQACLSLIRDLIKSTSINVDSDRIYYTGLSYGGKACWEFLKSAPELFAGALCCAGWPIGYAYSNPDPDLLDELAVEVAIYKDMPVWIFVGGADAMRYGSIAVYNEIISQGGTAYYTEYPGVDHVGSCTRTWSNSISTHWLFQQSIIFRQEN